MRLRIKSINGKRIRIKQEFIKIPKEEYVRLKNKAKIADDALIQLKLSLEDLRHGRVSKF